MSTTTTQRQHPAKPFLLEPLFGARLLIELAMNFRPTARRTKH
jgi:hypothetical protein